MTRGVFDLGQDVGLLAGIIWYTEDIVHACGPTPGLHGEVIGQPSVLIPLNMGS